MSEDAVLQIQRFNAARDPQRLQLKYLAMRGSLSAFLRGSCALFYDRLAAAGLLRTVAPCVWVCGDLHLENFGSYRADNGLVHFDISDCDESALAPATCDLLRLLTSVRTGAEGLHIDRRRAEALCRGFIQAYAESLALGKAYWVERDTAQGLVRKLLDHLQRGRRASFLDARTVVKRDRRQLRIDGKKAFPASDAERSAVEDCVRKLAQGQPKPKYFRVADVARRIAGTGSLGLGRYCVLVKGDASADGGDLLDLKQAAPSSLAPYLDVPQPAWRGEAHRIVELQRRIQAVSMALLHPVVIDGSDYVLRALQPSEERIALDRISQKAAQLDRLVSSLGRLVAWAHLRGTGRDGSATADELIAFGQRADWRAEVLDASKLCAAQVRKDAKAYNRAFDDGLFVTPEPAPR